MYREDKGVSKDEDKVLQYLRGAANQGDREAQKNSEVVKGNVLNKEEVMSAVFG